LSRLPSWMVVLRVVVIHADQQTGARSGLVGVLGDAPVQIIPVDERDRVEAYLALAEANKRNDPSEKDLQRYLAHSAHRALRQKVGMTFGARKVPSKLIPAIMFRFCTQVGGHQG
ncbi:hypothetical protein BO78DRAFT_276064, partial [Aspergillus sclerotiicarbonarius CBS 121057]